MIQIENYISGFLLKNKYCAISGLGTFELKRDSAYVKKENAALNAPEYSITFLPIGVIDDAFPTYIANFENVSISKASNDIKTFSQDVKTELKKTGRFDIQGVGHFTYDNNRILFHQDDTLNLERDPIQLYQEKKPEEEESLADAENFKDLHFTHSESGVGKPKTGALLKYLLGLLLLIGVAAASYFAYRYYQDHKSQEDARVAAPVEMETFDTDEASTDSSSNENALVPDSLNDSTAVQQDTTIAEKENTAPVVVAAAGEYKVAVQAFNNAVSAKMKSDKLSKYGNKTDVVALDDSYYLVIYGSHPSNDTTILKDSLRRFFNPSGKPFIVK